jgi:hypothetical protein
LDALAAAYHLEARIVGLTDSDDRILAALPMIHSKVPWRQRWTSLPFTDTLEPVAVTATYRNELLAAIAENDDGQSLIVRTHTTVPGWFSRQVGTVQAIDLSNGVEGALSSARRKTRQNVKLAKKAGLIARPITSLDEFLGPSRALTARSRQRLGAPTQPRRYWSRLWQLHERDEALTIGVYLGTKLVANGLFLIGSEHAVFKYSASELASRDLRTNYLTLATGLEHIAARGVRSIDLGITDIGNVTLREYKTKWGGEERPAHFSATDARLLPSTLEPGALLTRTIQHTPVFVGRAIGSLAYPFAA